MTPERKAWLQALDTFSQATSALMLAWETVERVEQASVGCEHYPRDLQVDFLEFCLQVSDWHHTQKEIAS